MTDERFDEPDFDDPAYAAIRDLLSSARVDEPIPTHVAARLDATLADLSAGAAGSDDTPTVVVPLRRRSKVGPRLLAAAAVIVVAGAGAVGLNQVVQNSGSNDAMSADRATAQNDSGDTTAPESAPQAPAVPSPVDGLLKDLHGLNNLGSISATAKVPVLTTAKFADQAAALTSGWLTSFSIDPDSKETSSRTSSLSPTPQAANPGSAGGVTAGDQNSTRDRTYALATKARTCTAPKIAGSTAYPIVLDGKPAVLVLYPVDDGTRLVAAWSCDGTQVLILTTLPAK